MNAIPFRGRHVHLIGIGGSGMSALAPLLVRCGAAVSGCDGERSHTVERLVAAGIPVSIGHDAAHVSTADLVVHTAAVTTDHPELVAARVRGVPVLTRGQCLVELMRGTRTVAVAGSHGKTSTTWMLAHLLVEAAVDPVVMVGGAVGSLGGNARAGGGSVFVAEVDESDGSFAQVRPELAIVTNLDHEHLRHYGHFRALEDAFNGWLRTIPMHGACIIPARGLSERVLDGVVCKVIRVGLDEGDWHARGLELGADGSRLEVSAWGESQGMMQVSIPGAHMVANALMAAAAARWIEPRTDLAAMARCERVRRRFTVHGTPRGVRVVEDYGHHPAEVRATIAAARLGGGRVHVLFQPHRHTRTADCFVDFVSAFDQAHGLALLPVYAAGEAPIAGVGSTELAQAISARRGEFAAGTVLATTETATALDFLAAQATPGDTCLVLGAGDVGRLAQELCARFPVSVTPEVREG
jgi:UDP-N-acetylmuramate--alanine ligase